MLQFFNKSILPTLAKGSMSQITQIWKSDVSDWTYMFYFQSEFWAETLILLNDI